MRKEMVLIVFVIIFLFGCSRAAGDSEKLDFKYVDVTKKSNLVFKHEKPVFDAAASNIMPWLSSTGASVAAGDYNNDGNIDLYFTNSKKSSKNVLFENLGDETFKMVDNKIISDINHDGVSTSALFFDYNNDGYSDLFVGSWGYSKLFENNGDGTYTEITKSSGINKFGYVSKAIALDFNKDGNLDLYLGNYFNSKNNLWNLKTSKIMNNDFETARNGGENLLYQNNGDGTFSEVSKRLGVDDPGWTLAVGSADINQDGYPDLYNANDFGPDSLYINEKGEKFNKVVQGSNIGADTHKGMNVDFVDAFHEGKLGIYVSNVSKSSYIIEGNDFWYPDEQGNYENTAKDLGISSSGFAWGSKFFDVNNSGEFSVMVTNGFITGKAKEDYWFDLGTLVTTPGNVVEDFKNWPKIGDKDLSGKEKKYLFLNMGKSKGFKNVAEQAGINFTEDGRGISVVDINNSGELDLVFANQGGVAKAYKNKILNKNNWIKIVLQGSYPSNRDAIGAKVFIKTRDKETIIERDGGNSHGGQSDPRIHFGVGEAKVIDEIKVVWPSGRIQFLNNVEVNKIVKIKENENIKIK